MLILCSSGATSIGNVNLFWVACTCAKATCRLEITSGGSSGGNSDAILYDNMSGWFFP